MLADLLHFVVSHRSGQGEAHRANRNEHEAQENRNKK
jgi:hypothetical protein